MNMDKFLGNQSERLQMIQFCEKKFQQRYHKGWFFSQIQKDLLMDIDKSVAIMDCVAGAGKTTILLSLAMWTIKRQEGESDAGCVHYMAENQELADDFQKRLEDLMGSSEGIFPLGYDQKNKEDRLTANVKMKIDQSNIPIVVAVRKLEAGVDYLVKQYVKDSMDEDRSCFAWDIIDVLKSVLLAHHVITHRTFYTQMRVHQAELLSNARVLVSTTATANKLNCGSSPWSRTFGNIARTISVPDEVQSYSALELDGLTASLSVSQTSQSSKSLKKLACNGIGIAR